jgi:hypothetical protein
MNQKLTIFICVVVALLAMTFTAPIPGKPSLWNYFQQKSINSKLSSFKDPVFLPGGKYRAGSTYSTYQGWDEAYEIRYVSGQEKQDVDSAYMLQFRADSTLISLVGEGPGNKELSDIKNYALSDNGCSAFDAQNKIDYCSSETFGYLIRTIDYKDETYYIAVTVFNGNAYPEPKTTEGFKPSQNSIEHNILKSVSAVEPELAKDYIKIDI